VSFEKLFQQAVLDAMHLFGWRTYHTFDSRRSAPGFPDICAVRRDRLLFSEIKGPRGKVTPAQQQWLEDLGRCAEAYLWREQDWERIEGVLR
jgi:hypothetical protein